MEQDSVVLDLEKAKNIVDKKNICFICVGSIETNVYFNRLLFEHFARIFKDITYLDVNNVFTSVLHHESNSKEAYSLLPMRFKVVVPVSLLELKRILKAHNMIAISFFSETWKDWYLYYYLKKYSIPLIYIYTMSSVVDFNYNLDKEIFFVRAVKKFIKILPYRLLRLFTLFGIFPKVDTYFVSNKERAKCCRSQKFCRYKEIVLTNSRFYDNVLSNNFKISQDYVVFLDSMLPYQGDQRRFGYTNIEKEPYYQNLNKVLDIIGKTTGKEVIVCLHPKYDNDNLKKDFLMRKAVKYKTDEFIAKAELVLFHESSAINTAILYGKKVIQLTGSYFNDFIKNNCQAYQNIFSFTTIDIYNCEEDRISEVIRTLKVNHEKYKNFLSNYIISSGENGVSSFEQIANCISNKYGVLKNGEK